MRHVGEDQGAGSNFVSCSTSRDATERYGSILYEIVLTHPHTKAIDANAAFTALTKHTNPFFDQKEISIYKHIRPTEVVAVWYPVKDPVIAHDEKIYDGLLFEERFKRYSREAWLSRPPVT